MKKGVAFLAIVVCVGLLAAASCYNSDSPDCLCFDNTAAWGPSGTWIQDIALDTVGTEESCVSDGGKPFYQIRLGLNSSSSANTMAAILEALTVVGINPYDREAWCSETISYWHREAGIPYSTGYRRSTWHLDWQLTNTDAIRTFYLVEELLDLMPFNTGRGRWIDWNDLDYSNFQPGINAPAPGSYVLIRKYDDATATWKGHSHSMMINEMTIHKDVSGDVVQVEVSLLEGNGGSPGEVRDTSSIDDLIAYTPAGSEWLSSGRKILGFGVDLDASGTPIFDTSRLHYQKDLFAVATLFKPIQTKDPLWERIYAPLVQKLVEYATKVKDGPIIKGPVSVIGKGGVPDGRSITWKFGPTVNRTQEKGIEITIDLLQDHPLPLLGVAIRWEGAMPGQFSVRFAANGQRYQSVSSPDSKLLKLSTRQIQSFLMPISFGKQSRKVRLIQLYFPPGSIPVGATISELSFMYDWGPSEDAEFNP